MKERAEIYLGSSRRVGEAALLVVWSCPGFSQHVRKG